MRPQLAYGAELSAPVSGSPVRHPHLRASCSMTVGANPQADSREFWSCDSKLGAQSTSPPILLRRGMEHNSNIGLPMDFYSFLCIGPASPCRVNVSQRA